MLLCLSSMLHQLPPSPYSLSLISQMIWVKYVFFSSMLFISVSHLSNDLSQICLLLFHALYLCLSSLRSACSWPKCCDFVVLDSFSRFISQIMLLFNSFLAVMFGNCFWKCFWLNPVIMDSIWSLVTSIGWDLGACMMLGIAFYLFAIGRPCNISWRRSGLNLKLARAS
jgi:hypothetical protein